MINDIFVRVELKDKSCFLCHSSHIEIEIGAIYIHTKQGVITIEYEDLENISVCCDGAYTLLLTGKWDK